MHGVPLTLAAVTIFSVTDALAMRLGQLLPPVEVARMRYGAFLLLTLAPALRAAAGDPGRDRLLSSTSPKQPRVIKGAPKEDPGRLAGVRESRGRRRSPHRHP